MTFYAIDFFIDATFSIISHLVTKWIYTNSIYIVHCYSQWPKVVDSLFQILVENAMKRKKMGQPIKSLDFSRLFFIYKLLHS